MNFRTCDPCVQGILGCRADDLGSMLRVLARRAEGLGSALRVMARRAEDLGSTLRVMARRAEDLGSTLRVIPGRMPFGPICRLRNLLPGNRTGAISRNLIITIDKRDFSLP